MTSQKIIKVLGLPDGSVRQSSAEKNKIFFVLYLTHPHVMRHTGCTNMARSGVNIKAAQYIMGHAKSDITLDVYNPLNNRYDAKTEIEKLEKNGVKVV